MPYRRVSVVVACCALLLASSVVRPPATPAAPTRAELEAARARLIEIEAEFQTVSERYNQVNARLTEIQSAMGTTDLEIGRLTDDIERQEDEAIAMARELYMSGGAVDIEAALSAETFSEFETRLAYLSSSNEARTDVFVDLARGRALLQKRFSDLEAGREYVTQARTRLDALRSEIASKIASQRAEIEQLNAIVEAAERAEARRLRLRARSTAASPAGTGGYEGSAARFVGVDVKADPATNPAAQAAVDFAMAQIGKPYRWGAQGPDTFDCSGLTMMAWLEGGVTIPRVSYVQYAALPKVDRSELEPGDLVFFGDPIHHVGMYIGRGLMVEAPYTGSYVRINSATRPDYVGAVRPG